MEGHRSEVRDENDANTAKATPSCLPYRAPRLTVTGTAVTVIHGSHPSGVTDRNAPDFWWYGE